MNKAAKVLLAVFSLFLGITVNGQEYVPLDTVTKSKGFYLGGQAATSGYGLNVKYVISERFTLKSGFETFNFSKGFNFDENDVTYSADFNYKTGGIFLLADFYFAKKFYVSAGVASTSFNPTIVGEAVSDLQYGDISIPASDVGGFNFEIKPSLNISPYLAAGFRTFFGAGKRVVYTMETGFYYIGSPEISINADGLLAPTADPAHKQKELFEKQLQQYKFYPVLKFNIAVKLF